MKKIIFLVFSFVFVFSSFVVERPEELEESIRKEEERFLLELKNTILKFMKKS